MFHFYTKNMQLYKCSEVTFTLESFVEFVILDRKYKFHVKFQIP